MRPIVQFDSVTKRFRRKILVNEVSFKLYEGEVTTLIGQNGAGKTTIAKMMLGLMSPSHGGIIIKPGLNIGYAPQKLNFSFSMPLNAQGLMNILVPTGIDKEVMDCIEFLDFDKIKKLDLSNLSGGQMQKLMLAATLLNKPDLVILDEPLQYLDVTSQQNFYKSLTKIKENFGLTIFMISHDLFTVMKNSDQVICINRHVCCAGKPSEINGNADFQNVLSEIGVYAHSHDHEHDE